MQSSKRPGEFSLEDFISLKGRPSRKGWVAGLMIDDFILLEQVDLEKQSLEETPGRKKVERVREMYDRVGLPRHSGKAVSCALKAEFWGGEVNGETGLVTPNAKRMIPLVHTHHAEDCATPSLFGELARSPLWVASFRLPGHTTIHGGLG